VPLNASAAFPTQTGWYLFFGTNRAWLTASTTDYTQLVASAASIYDAGQTAEVVAAKIANYKRMRDALPKGSPGWVVLDNRIRVLQGKYRAKSESQARDTAWSRLGRTGVVVGIGVGLSLIGLIVTAAVRQRRLAAAGV
jgi:hypothetical protein